MSSTRERCDYEVHKCKVHIELNLLEMVRSKQGKAKHRQKVNKIRECLLLIVGPCENVTKYLANTSTRHGFDGCLSPPLRQTASVLKQPVTIVTTSSKNTKPAPAVELKRATGRLTKPQQLFALKRLDRLRACTFLSPLDCDEVRFEKILAPQKVLLSNCLAIGPGITEETATLSLAAALQSPTHGIPVTGQTGPKRSLDANPSVNINAEQPLIQTVVISEQDVLNQEERVLNARRRLEDALKNFGKTK
ncbi:putative methyl-CpG-binding domain protein 2 [Trichinella spiralis]|uniref:putative methyl-CpG-binding domain protein 2 n=1 Tax=Trichinella spiralis TaxID=6334 RepID=UPI0001EFC3DA|nr:putative methyl-CpG-binding domain protein 2 [Trichinella spiralis]